MDGISTRPAVSHDDLRSVFSILNRDIDVYRPECCFERSILHYRVRWISITRNSHLFSLSDAQMGSQSLHQSDFLCPRQLEIRQDLGMYAKHDIISSLMSLFFLICSFRAAETAISARIQVRTLVLPAAVMAAWYAILIRELYVFNVSIRYLFTDKLVGCTTCDGGRVDSGRRLFHWSGLV